MTMLVLWSLLKLVKLVSQFHRDILWNYHNKSFLEIVLKCKHIAENVVLLLVTAKVQVLKTCSGIGGVRQ